MATDSDIAREQYQNYRYCYDNGHDRWLQSAKQCFEYWRGNQWDGPIKARLEREGRPALTFNIIESLVRAMVGVHRALRNDVRFAPLQNANDESARIMDAVWLHTQAMTNLDFLESEVYKKGLIMGRAYYDVRVRADEGMRSWVDIKSPRSQDILLDPGIDTYETDDWPQVISRRWVSYNDIRNAYGKAKAEKIGYERLPAWFDYEDTMQALQMGALPYYSCMYAGDTDLRAARAHLLTERQYATIKRKDVFVDVNTGDWSEIPEVWDADRVSHILQTVPGLTTTKRDVRTIRWTVTCEDTVLHDEDSPYKHFTVVPFFPSFVDGVTLSPVEQLLDSQQLFNKITSSELHIISTTANSGWKVKKGSLKNMTIQELEEVGARTGFVAELDNIDDMQKISPNSTPQGHDRLSFKADQIMRNLSGVSNQARGFAREDVAGAAILQNQAGQDVNFAEYMANLHRSKKMLAANVRDCVQTFYTDTRVLKINRGSAYQPQTEDVTLNEPTPEGLMLNDVAEGKYTSVLIPAPSRTTMSEEDFQLMMKLRTEVGIAIPDQLMIEMSPAVNKAHILEALQGPDSNERARQAEQAAAEQAQIKAQKEQAQAQKDMAAAQLNQARAEKASIEAASDPDASYERVESQRIQSEADAAAQTREMKRLEFERRMEFEERKHADAQRTQRKALAVRLAELDLDSEHRDLDRIATQSTRQAARRGNDRPDFDGD